MRLQISKSKDCEKTWHRTGVRKRLNGQDPYVWANDYVDKLNMFQLSEVLWEQPDFELQHIYRATDYQIISLKQMKKI